MSATTALERLVEAARAYTQAVTAGDAYGIIPGFDALAAALTAVGPGTP